MTKQEFVLARRSLSAAQRHVENVAQAMSNNQADGYITGNQASLLVVSTQAAIASLHALSRKLEMISKSDSSISLCSKCGNWMFEQHTKEMIDILSTPVVGTRESLSNFETKLAKYDELYANLRKQIRSAKATAFALPKAKWFSTVHLSFD